MRIAFVITRSDSIGGGQIHVLDLAEAMLAEGHEILLLAGGTGALFDAADERGIAHRSIPSLVREVSPALDARALIELRRAFVDFQPQLTTLHSSKAGILGRLSTLGLPTRTVLTVHGWAFVRDRGPLITGIFTGAEILTAPLADHIITVCDFDTRAARGPITKLARGRLSRIYNGVKEHPARADPGVGTPRIISVARMSEPKRPDLILEALAGLTDLAWEMEFVGDGPDLNSIQAHATQLGLDSRVRFSGRCEDVPARLASSSLFVLATDSEGFPLSVLEAMRSGLPVIANDVGGVGEALQDGLQGRIVPANDIAALNAALRELLSSSRLRERMGAAARTRYEAEFTFDRQLRATISLFEHVLGDSAYLPTMNQASQANRVEVEASGASEPFRQADCVFCALGDCDTVLSRPRFSVRQCPRCSVLWCDPLRFNESFNADNEDAYIEVEETITNENRGRLDLLEKLAPASTHPRAVEIGCMHGDFVSQMRSAGYEGEGLDLSHTAVDAAARINPGCVRYGTLDENVADNSLDVVAAFNVIEHMDAPHEFLAEVKRVLRPGGVLVLETPKQESIYHHIMFARARLRANTEAVEVGVHPGTHIFKFGLRSWRTILNDRGFSVIEAQSKSTPLAELLTKNAKAPLTVRIGIVAAGAAARVTGLDNRILLLARLSGTPDASHIAS